MSLKTLTCIEAACDDCGTPHFKTTEDALDELVKHHEWTIADDTQLCSRCTAKRMCDAEGHKWAEWRNGARSSAGKRHRWCDRDYCNGFEEEPIQTKFPVVADQVIRPAAGGEDRG